MNVTKVVIQVGGTKMNGVESSRRKGIKRFNNWDLEKNRSKQNNNMMDVYGIKNNKNRRNRSEIWKMDIQNIKHIWEIELKNDFEEMGLELLEIMKKNEGILMLENSHVWMHSGVKENK